MVVGAPQAVMFVMFVFFKWVVGWEGSFVGSMYGGLRIEEHCGFVLRMILRRRKL